MKKINIFGKKIPILAILAVLLLIGTASAAVFTHYATLSGKVTVEQTIFVNNLPIGGDVTGLLNFNDGDIATFSITNVGDVSTDVELVTTIKEVVTLIDYPNAKPLLDGDSSSVVDGYGNALGEIPSEDVSVTYTAFNGITTWDINNIVTIPPTINNEQITITVTFIANQNVIGTFNVYTDVIIPGSVS